MRTSFDPRPKLKREFLRDEILKFSGEPKRSAEFDVNFHQTLVLARIKAE
jgi:hypothetical protein